MVLKCRSQIGVYNPIPSPLRSAIRPQIYAPSILAEAELVAVGEPTMNTLRLAKQGRNVRAHHEAVFCDSDGGREEIQPRCPS
jgi:hypothetical protein